MIRCIKEYKEVNDKLYGVLKTKPVEKFQDKQGQIQLDIVKMYMEWMGANHVLRNQTHYIFCLEIPEPEWEEIKENTN